MFFDFLGDEGSAFWIAHKAITTFFKHDDGLIPSPHPVDFIKKEMFDFFNLKHKQDMLPHAYNFDKENYAQFCEKGVVKGAKAGDPFCLEVLQQAGFDLGLHVKALIPKMECGMLEKDKGLKILCVGSVWKSWEFLKDGFLKGIEKVLLQILSICLYESSYLCQQIVFVLPFENSTLTRRG